MKSLLPRNANQLQNKNNKKPEERLIGTRKDASKIPLPNYRYISLAKINDYLISSSMAQRTKTFLVTHHLQATLCIH